MGEKQEGKGAASSKTYRTHYAGAFQRPLEGPFGSGVHHLGALSGQGGLLRALPELQPDLPDLGDRLRRLR